jgi:hypothetical protein
VRLGRIIPPLALAVFVLLAYWRFVDLFFQGGDTWPHIWTTRLDSPGALVGILSEPIMDGTIFPEEVALFFRPLSSLSYSVNYALSGMNPFAFHLTDVLIHTAATLALFGLLTALGLRPWAAAVGAATFAIHPAMASLVPSLPRRHDSLAAVGAFLALAIAAWIVRQPRTSGATWVWLGVATASLGLGELAKESGYLGLALAPPTLVAATLTVKDRWRARLGRVAVVLVAFVVVSGLMFTWRWLVLGGIGGYYERTPPLANLDVALSDLLQNLLFPWYEQLGRTPRAWLTEVGLVALFSGLPILIVGRRAGRVIVCGWVWLIACSVFQLLTKSLAAWHSYFTIAGFAFLVGGVLDGSVEALATRPRQVLVSAVAIAGLVGVLIFEVGVVSTSVLTRPFDEWRIAGEVARSYLYSLRPCLEQAPPGVPVHVANAPDSIETSTPERIMIHAGILGPYSVGPAVRLLMPDVAPDELATRNFTRPGALPSRVSSRCALEDGVWLIRTDYVP